MLPLFSTEMPRSVRPTLKELEKKTALALQFGHPLIMDGVRPMAPNYINVGMMNCRPPKKLPENLQNFMDQSGEEGVVFVSKSPSKAEINQALLSHFSLF